MGGHIIRAFPAILVFAVPDKVVSFIIPKTIDHQFRIVLITGQAPPQRRWVSVTRISVGKVI